MQYACDYRPQRVGLRDRRNNPHTTAIGPMPKASDFGFPILFVAEFSS